MDKIKKMARRGAFFAAAVSLFGATAFTAAFPALASADALNPLTERSLKLSSSSPGYHYLDGAGNTTYAPPGSGPNGKQTSETFSFKSSTDSSGGGTATIKGFDFQYCVTPAGYCQSPGNDAAFGGSDGVDHTDLSVNYTAPVEGTDFEIFLGNDLTGTPSSGWTMTTDNKEDAAHITATGKNNYIMLTNTTGITPPAGQLFTIVFYAHNTNYITNPGAGAFFVKLNTFNTATTSNFDTAHTIDGGVTVANVMNDSIQIQTKVLETMSFSVGTTNPDTVAGSHGSCDAISVNDPINLGDVANEYSLSTTTAYDGISYWRLSSNSSNGATVYYSGYSLSNTEGDHIKAAYDLNEGSALLHEGDGSTTISHPGTEQFGLALLPTNSTQRTDPNPSGLGSTGVLAPLVPASAYGNGDGLINGTPDAQFAFKSSSISRPEPLASESTDIIHCSTGKVRYLANIAPDTPAGIYTAKVNYIASPEY